MDIKLKEKFWFDCLILMFQKEVADRILAKFNTKYYSRLSIISNWRLEIKKICDVKPTSFSKPKVDSSIIFFKPKKNFHKFKDQKILRQLLEFFMHRRKMVKKPYNQIFNGKDGISKKLNIDLNLRPKFKFRDLL